jgi:hypothetical protein
VADWNTLATAIREPRRLLLGELEVTQQDAANFSEGAVRRSFSHRRTKPVVVEKIKRRRPPRDGKTAKMPNRSRSSRPRCETKPPELQSDRR